MAIWGLVGPVVNLVTKVLDKYVPGYKDKRAQMRLKSEKEAIKWKDKEKVKRKERIKRQLESQSASRSRGAPER